MELQYRGNWTELFIVQRELDGAYVHREESMLIIFAIFGVAIGISLFMGLSGKNR